MVDVLDFRDCTVRPTLLYLKMHSLAAEQLVLGTAMHESRLRFLRQIGGGPALGLFQMEPDTHKDIWINYLAFRPVLAARVLKMRALWASTESQLTNNSAYACAMCRLRYRRVREPLPFANDPEGIAQYWKRHYNTRLGDGKVSDFALAFEQYVKPLYN